MNIKHPSGAQIPELRQLWKEAFGDTDAFLDCFFNTAFSSRRCLCATVGCEIAAAAYWFSCGQYAYIYAVATGEKHRGKGLCHALMARIHQLLTEQGYAGCMVVPGEESLRQFYGGMGYENFGGITELQCQAGVPLPIRKISTEEYARLRRQYLPHGGVVQEGENLAFLACMAQFYTGEDFLLAATGEGTMLRGIELLGNYNAAPGILGSLGAVHGNFRIPGHTSFAMYKPLCSKNSPEYFGFAFD